MFDIYLTKHPALKEHYIENVNPILTGKEGKAVHENNRLIWGKNNNL